MKKIFISLVIVAFLSICSLQFLITAETPKATPLKDEPNTDVIMTDHYYEIDRSLVRQNGSHTFSYDGDEYDFTEHGNAYCRPNITTQINCWGSNYHLVSIESGIPSDLKYSTAHYDGHKIKSYVAIYASDQKTTTTKLSGVSGPGSISYAKDTTSTVSAGLGISVQAGFEIPGINVGAAVKDAISIETSSASSSGISVSVDLDSDLLTGYMTIKKTTQKFIVVVLEPEETSTVVQWFMVYGPRTHYEEYSSNYLVSVEYDVNYELKSVRK